MTDKKIVIIGAGISGLVAAQSLRKKNIDFEIYSKPDKKNYDIDIRQPAYNALKEALSEDKLKELIDSQPYRRTTFHQLKYDLTELMVITKEDKTDSLYCFEKKKMLEILSEGIDVKECKEIKNITDGEKVKVEFEDKEVECDILVVADGSKSKCRSILYGKDLVEHKYVLLTGKTMLSEIETNDFTDKLDKGPLLVYGDGDGIYMSKYKLQDEPEFISWYFSCDKADIKGEEPYDYICKSTEGWDQKIRDVILKCDKKFTIDHVKSLDDQFKDKLLSFDHEKILFMGDAGHAMAPFKGIGGSTAVEDANDLSQAIEKYLKSNDIDVLKNYTRSVTDRGFKGVKESEKACGYLHTKGYIAQFARDTTLKAVSYAINFGK